MSKSIPPREWQPDQALDGFDATTIELGDANDGPLVATLVRKKGEEATGRAVLYLHGFIDYFFQSHVAHAFVDRGWDFYALDLRRYGRSLKAGQRPNYITDVAEYDAEIESAIEIIKSEDRHDVLVMMGHSTGGLTASFYLHRGARKETIDALVLNSPFFAFSVPSVRRYLLPIAGALGALAPWGYDPIGISEHYGQSLLSEYHGEWTYDVRWKPVKGFPVYYGWVRAIRRVQSVVARGLSLELPVLVLHSGRSMPATGDWKDAFLRSDIVLEVDDMRRVGQKLGPNVTVVSIDGGMHDIFLSGPEVRRVAIETTLNWLNRQSFAGASSGRAGNSKTRETGVKHE